MEVKLSQIESDIKTLYKSIKRQEEATTNLTNLASSIVELTTELKYMRLDVSKNKEQIECIKSTLDEHEKSSIQARLMKYEVVENQIKSWILKGILALVVIGFIAAMGLKLRGGI